MYSPYLHVTNHQMIYYNNYYFHSIIDSGSKRLATAIRDCLTAYEASLSSLLVGGTISKFATEMHQANLISRSVAGNPSYHAIVDQFMAALQLHSELSEIEQQCSTFFQILYDIGGPLKNASETMKKELVQNVKSRMIIDLNKLIIPEYELKQFTPSPGTCIKIMCM